MSLLKHPAHPGAVDHLIEGLSSLQEEGGIAEFHCRSGEHIALAAREVGSKMVNCPPRREEHTRDDV
jgi:hypothetical protein